MQRVRDLARFGLWCGGIGYMVFILIRDADQRPSVLQIVGILAAIATLIQLLVIAKRHQRDGEGSPKIQIRRRRPDSTVMRVKARNHFGLRGVDR